jgi:hypothetical protein
MICFFVSEFYWPSFMDRVVVDNDDIIIMNKINVYILVKLYNYEWNMLLWIRSL